MGFKSALKGLTTTWNTVNGLMWTDRISWALQVGTDEDTVLRSVAKL